jgi:hypothetical protein
VAGEFRFRHGYCKGNPRKMVRTWAEKEMRNYIRLHGAGLPTAEPLLLRGHVLLMRFIGIDGLAAPRLKDAGLGGEKAASAYQQVRLNSFSVSLSCLIFFSICFKQYVNGSRRKSVCGWARLCAVLCLSASGVVARLHSSPSPPQSTLQLFRRVRACVRACAVHSPAAAAVPRVPAGARRLLRVQPALA